MFKEWIDRFHKDGFLVVPNILSKEECEVLKFDYEAAYRRNKQKIQKRMFEHSWANLELFWKEPIVSFAEQLIGDNGTSDLLPKDLPAFKPFDKGFPSANEVHVIHNNSFSIRAERPGIANSTWHQDDTPHITSLDGSPLQNVRLNVLAFTCNYYLTDVLLIENGPTQFIPKSHLFGQHCTDGRAEAHLKDSVYALGSAGTAVMFNNQVWHRGTDNTSNQDRLITQITYAKRLVGHKHGNFIDYHLPAEIIQKISDPRKKRLLGIFRSWSIWMKLVEFRIP